LITMGMTEPDTMDFENCLKLLDTLNVAAPGEANIVSILALGKIPQNGPRGRGISVPSLENSGVLNSLHFLVAPASGDPELLQNALISLKSTNPSLKILLADSVDNPSIADESSLPEGVQVIPTSVQQARNGSEFASQHLGLLVGSPGGRTAFLATELARQLKDDKLIGMLLTNLPDSA